MLQKSTSVFFLLVTIGLLITSCTFTFGGLFPNTPQGNYDFFFYELDQSYAYKDATFEQGLTLSQIQDLEDGQLDDTWASLQYALNRVINIHIKDPHLYSKYSPVPVLEFQDDEILKGNRGLNNFDINLPILHVSTIIDWIEIDKYLFYGTVKSDPKIGYIYIDSLVDKVGGSARLSESNSKFFGDFTDKILSDFSAKGVKSIIIDIRSTVGGAIHRGKQIASRFVNTEKTFMISEYKTSPNNYNTVHETIAPVGNANYRGTPLIILVNTLTCSGGEMMVLMFQQADGYKETIGTNTAGCAGTVIEKELPNGWIFRITTSKTYTKDKQTYFRNGLSPTKRVVFGTNDAILSNAIAEISKY